MAEEGSGQKLRKQHPVPQHIMGVEFKLVGSLTIRQFLWVAGGLILAYLIFNSALPTLWRYILGGGVALLGLAVAFLPVQEQGLEKWIANFITAVTSPTQRVWKKSESIPELFLAEYKVPSVKTPFTPPKDRARLEQYLETLERKKVRKAGDELEMKEKELLKKWGFKPITMTAPPTAPPPPTYRPPFKEGVERASPTPTLASETNYALQPVISIPVGGGKRLISSIKNVRPGRKLHLLPGKAPVGIPVKGELVVEGKEKEPLPKDRPLISIPEIPPEQKEREIKKQIEKITERIKGLKKKPLQPPPPAPRPPKTAPVAKEETKELERLKEARRKLEEERKKLEEINLRYQTKISELTSQNSRFNEEMRRIQKEVEELRTYTSKVTAKNEAYNRRLKEQEARLEEVAKEKEKTEENLKKMQEKLTMARSRAMGKAAGMEKGIEERVSIPKPPKKHLPPIIKDVPNVINGIVKGKNGQLLEGAVVIVKDEQQEPVRALKTNELGQFAITTPLPNGRYTVEIEKSGLNFDIMTVDILGTVLEPIEIQGHD